MQVLELLLQATTITSKTQPLLQARLNSNYVCVCVCVCVCACVYRGSLGAHWLAGFARSCTNNTGLRGLHAKMSNMCTPWHIESESESECMNACERGQLHANTATGTLRQTDWQTDRQFESKIYRQTDRQTDNGTDRQPDRQTHKQTCGHTDKQTDGQGQRHRHTHQDRQTDSLPTYLLGKLLLGMYTPPFRISNWGGKVTLGMYTSPLIISHPSWTFTEFPIPMRNS